MKLCDLLRDVQAEYLSGPADCMVTDVCYDSRKVKPGSLFIAIKGFKSDGHAYLKKAVEQGAAALLVQDAPDFALPEQVSSTAAAIPAPRWQMLLPIFTITLSGNCGS